MYGFFYGFLDGCFAAFHFQFLDRINHPANVFIFRKFSTKLPQSFAINFRQRS